MKSLFYYIFFLCCFCSTQIVIAQTTEKPNIIFIVLDDLNDWAEGFDGHPQARTATLASISEQGTLFYNAYASAPQCGPSRTSFLSGKDIAYTQVGDNTKVACGAFSSNFSEETNNAEYFTLPGYFKDSAGYYTYNVGKIFHCWENYVEYDSTSADPCNRPLSWDKYFFKNEDSLIEYFIENYNEGIGPYHWGRIEESDEMQAADYVATDSAVAFLEALAAGEEVTCGKPFFLAVGIHRPHFPVFSSAGYWYNEFYMEDVHAEPFHISVNYPEGSTPYNGIVIPRQTSPIRYQDVNNLPADGMARLTMLDQSDIKFTLYADTISPLPEINASYSDSLRKLIVENSKRANYINGYLASIYFADTQVGRVVNALGINPEVYNNTIIVIIGDHGFSLGEKTHWQKSMLWETDIRSTMIIADLRNPTGYVSYRMASFLDLFPTLCDLADLPYPTFSDGSNYLDGKSLVPYMENGFRNADRPLLSSITNNSGKPASCYPHFSVRNNRFHYIKYIVQSGTDFSDCDSVPGEYEEELYDIGITKQTDPYEWYNLSEDPDYIPAKDFLKQWIPGGAMYLQEAVNVEISFNDTTPCYLSEGGSIELIAILYDSLATLITSPLESGFTLQWTNNINSSIGYGNVFMFNVDAFPAEVFDSIGYFYVYLNVIDSSTMRTVGFNMQKIFLNPINTPTINFNTGLELKTITIKDYVSTGIFSNPVWDFGDGTEINIAVPGPHFYTSSGFYTIQHTVEFGNSCVHTIAKKIYIPVYNALNNETPEINFTLYPNPANQELFFNISSPLDNALLLLKDAGGKVLLQKEYQHLEIGNYMINIKNFPQGTYSINITNNDYSLSKLFVIVR
ncbi:MAG: sulfatase-like hydrolase/transferase [Chitinophagales bacterium]|nr:sulfatase-like hydrolase/transferase [Chitinophagales bacterium]